MSFYYLNWQLATGGGGGTTTISLVEVELQPPLVADIADVPVTGHIMTVNLDAEILDVDLNRTLSGGYLSGDLGD